MIFPVNCNSIRCKLMAIILLTSGIAIIVITGAFVIHEAFSYRRTVKEEMISQADMFGNSTASALLFNDPASARDTLATAKANPRILAVYLLTPNKQIFAHYQDDKAVERRSEGGISQPGSLAASPFMLLDRVHQDSVALWTADRDYLVARDVTLDGQTVGIVIIHADMQGLYTKLGHFVGLSFLVMIAAYVLIFFIATKLQRLISGPISELAVTMKQVSLEKNYALRVENRRNDEIGTLNDCFNEMLTEIESRDEMLRQRQTSLLQQQRKLEELNFSLGESIAKAVAELRHKDQMLIQQNRLAAMGEMLNNIAHQWRQPLNNVSLLVQSLMIGYELGQTTEEEMRTTIDQALENIDFLSQTIDDFRHFFSYDKQQTPFSVNEVVSGTINFIAASFQHSRIAVDIEAEDALTVGFPNQYSQVLLNILNNAKDVLTERQPPAPRVSIRVFTDHGRAVVTIRDNGGGIREDVVSRIFDPYFTTKDAGKGTGIGLYMSKVIVEQNMNGALTARNVEDGAELRIETPGIQGLEDPVPASAQV